MSRHATVEQLSAYIDEELVEREQQTLERHLEGCNPCRDRLAGLRGAANRLRLLSSAAPPPPLEQRVRRAVQSVSVGGRLLERVERTVRGGLIQPVFGPAFAVVLALGAIIYLFSIGVAREQGSRTQVILPPADEGSPEVPAAAEVRQEPAAPSGRAEALRERLSAPAGVDAIQIGERWFEAQGDGELWIERGLAGVEPEEVFEVAAGESVEIPGLGTEEVASLESLGRVVLSADRRVIEIAFDR